MIISPEVQRYADRVAAQTGSPPQILETRSGWEVVSRNERVCNVAHFRRSPGNRVYFVEAELFVDGKPRPLIDNDEEFGRLWADPDYRQRLPGDFSPDADYDDAPLSVRLVFDRLSPVLGEHLRLGFEQGRWMVGVEADRAQLRMTFRRRGRSWAPHRVLLVIDGVNRSREIDDSLEKALALIVGVELGSPELKPGVPATSTPRSRSNSVEVRNTVVMRN